MIGTRIVLIDGQRQGALMACCNVGCHGGYALHLKDFDGDWFV